MPTSSAGSYSGSRETLGVAGGEAPDIDLIRVVRNQLEPKKARHEGLLGRKIVIHAPHGEVAGGGQCNVGREALNVGPVAEGLRAGRIRQGVVGVPYLLHQRVDADSTRIGAQQAENLARGGVRYVPRSQSL